MTVHLYLSLIPEALIASMLPPQEFGVYYTVGYSKKMRGQAMFIELDPDFRHDFFPIEQGIARCVPHENGSLKKSVYIATYRVLEHIPLAGCEDTLPGHAIRGIFAPAAQRAVPDQGRGSVHVPRDSAEIPACCELAATFGYVPISNARSLESDPFAGGLFRRTATWRAC